MFNIVILVYDFTNNILLKKIVGGQKLWDPGSKDPNFLQLCIPLLTTQIAPRKNPKNKTKSKPKSGRELLKRGSWFYNFSDTLIDQKSPALFVPVANKGDTRHVHTRPT